MKAPDKELLLKDLCARLPYGVLVFIRKPFGCVMSEEEEAELTTDTLQEFIENDDMLMRVLPYLRPMSSMTSKEWLEYCDACVEDEKSWTWARTGKEYKFTPITHREEFLNAHHFDYRGLIPKGLALEAPEDMYKI